MARAPLRPVPGRPAEPVSDADSVALVAVALPSLPEPDRTTLALVALAGLPRRQVALHLGRDAAEVSAALARARKQLRRSVASLGGSGWCERAELLISDRMDGALGAGDAARLDVHLRNCPRCVEHERRLVQATDALVASAGGAAYAFAPDPAQPAAAKRAATATAPADAPARSDLLAALPLTALIAVSVLLALAAVVLAAIALGLSL